MVTSSRNNVNILYSIWVNDTSAFLAHCSPSIFLALSGLHQTVDTAAWHLIQTPYACPPQGSQGHQYNAWYHQNTGPFAPP